MRKYTADSSPVKYEQLDLFSAERWQPIPGYDPRYEASDRGRIRAKTSGKGQHPKPIILGSYVIKIGYEYVKMWRDNRMNSVGVHQLVAAAFFGPCPDGMEVNHKDGDKRNNQVSNLEYCSHRDNIRHAWQNGLARVRSAKFTAEQVGEIRALLASGMRQVDIAAKFDTTQGTISQIKRGAYRPKCPV